MQISIVIPVKNAEKTLPLVLQAARRAAFSNTEILVVDDGSSDESVKIAKEYSCHIVSTGGSGVAAARNLGAREASSEIILFIDADIVIAQDAIQIILEDFQNDPGLSAITGLLGAKLPFTDFASIYKNLWMHYTYRSQSEDQEIPLFYTSAAAIRREIFLQHGGFDESYRKPGVEDTEFGNRLARAGEKVKLEHRLQVTHLKRYQLFDLLKLDFARSAGLVKVIFQHLAKPKGRTNPTSIPVSFIINVIVSFPTIVFGLLAILYGKFWAACLIGLFFMLLTFVLNQKFLSFLYRLQHYMFFIKSFFFLLLDFVFIDLGVLYGFIKYVIMAQHGKLRSSSKE